MTDSATVVESLELLLAIVRLLDADPHDVLLEVQHLAFEPRELVLVLDGGDSLPGLAILEPPLIPLGLSIELALV